MTTKGVGTPVFESSFALSSGDFSVFLILSKCGKLAHLGNYAPELGKKLAAIPHIGSQAINLAPLPFSEFTTSRLRDLQGNNVVTQSFSDDDGNGWEEYYHPEDLEKEFGFGELIVKKGKKSIPPSQVIRLILKCVICPMCDSIYSWASAAADQSSYVDDD